MRRRTFIRSRKPRESDLDRRVFLQRLALWGGGGWLVLGPACKRPPETPAKAPVKPGWMAKNLVSSHQTFTDAEYEVLSAATERLLPRDQDPGAIDLGVPVYVDRMLTSPELREMKGVVIGGLTLLEKRAEVSYGKSYAQLLPEQQDALLKECRDAPKGSGKQHFFEVLFALAMEGALGDPSYGGNKDRQGWALVGFDTSMPAGYMPPGMKMK